jgi:hypothetical protein
VSRQGFLTAAGRLGPVAGLLEDAADELQDARIIIDDEDAFLAPRAQGLGDAAGRRALPSASPLGW